MMNVLDVLVPSEALFSDGKAKGLKGRCTGYSLGNSPICTVTRLQGVQSKLMQCTHA